MDVTAEALERLESSKHVARKSYEIILANYVLAFLKYIDDILS